MTLSKLETIIKQIAKTYFVSMRYISQKKISSGDIDIFIGIIDSRAVHDDHRGIQADLTDLADKESGRMFRNHTDPCAVLVQITQTEEHG